ncbi:unnamed protein product [Prorocentrum cordatum]|uniref:Uncharacterized protein n=1 Tax=Prorocentrum cordatum TaxID=2364126 RepID=A0ABN9VBQ7_9DINO|nr:unnamed protein product [Polarella glacialis]
MPKQAGRSAGTALALIAAAFAPRTGLGIQPAAKGHFLTSREPRNITSVVDCLKAKQEDPTVECSESANTSEFTGKLSAGNFPDYEDAVCKSVNDEFFCDFDGLLSEKERQVLAWELKKMRNDNLVPCGRLLHDKVDPWHLQPFYLGVVVLADWPLKQADPESLQQFGQVVASQWNMDKTYAGNPPGRLTCPNTGVLLVLPSLRQAYLSTASCEFICQAHRPRRRGRHGHGEGLELGLEAGRRARGRADDLPVLGRADPQRSEHQHGLGAGSTGARGVRRLRVQVLRVGGGGDQHLAAGRLRPGSGHPRCQPGNWPAVPAAGARLPLQRQEDLRRERSRELR